MSKSHQRIDTQLSIFGLLKELSAAPPTRTEGQLAVADRLRVAIRAAIKGCPLSRHQIAGEMSHLVSDTITKEMIDSWTREDQEIPFDPPLQKGEVRIRRHVPAEYLPALCKVTGSIEPIRVLCQGAGFFVFEGPDAMRAEMKRIEEQIEELQAEKKKRRVFLQEMEAPKAQEKG